MQYKLNDYSYAVDYFDKPVNVREECGKLPPLNVEILSTNCLGFTARTFYGEEQLNTLVRCARTGKEFFTLRRFITPDEINLKAKEAKMEKKTEFKVDDCVERINRSNTREFCTMEVGAVGVVKDVDAWGWLKIRGYEDLDHQNYINFKLAEPSVEYYSALNYKDAVHLIGKVVDGCDDGETWCSGGVLERLDYDKGAKYRFEGDNGDWEYIRTCKETFAPAIPEIHPDLIPALKKSIQQWQIMYDTGKRKKEVYEFLGGESDRITGCFLCDKFIDKCESEWLCLNWTDTYTMGNRCCNEGSPYRAWGDNASEENTLKVLNYLKSELKKLEEN